VEFCNKIADIDVTTYRLEIVLVVCLALDILVSQKHQLLKRY